ncbi:MAG: hypothetical protein AB1516_09115 [Pseudomonadota bacterium]|jgi:hypothetical protein
MGWFSNSMTANRAANSIQLVGVMASMADSKLSLDNVNQFVAQQKQRAQGLSAQAFALQGASSQLGCDLQRAVNDISTYLAQGHEVVEDLDSRMASLATIIEQFNLPRGARDLNMSGRDMTTLVTASAIEVRGNLEVLKRNHGDKVNAAVETVDQADRQLNGDRSVRALGSIPRFE